MSNLSDNESRPAASGASPHTNSTSSPVTRRSARLVFATMLAAIGLWIARDFLVPLGWAVILAVALWPVYRRFVACGWFSCGSVLPPLIFTVLMGLVLIIPLG